MGPNQRPAVPELEDQFPGGDPDAVEPLQVLVNFVTNVEEFMDFVFAFPPGPIRGQWLEQEEDAWLALRERVGRTWGSFGEQVRQAALDRAGEDGQRRGLSMEDALEERLNEHGLRGQPLRTKINAWRDRSRDFFKKRSTNRLAKALRTAAVILESIAECAGVGGAYKEAVKGLHHLTEIAVEEGA